MSGLSSITNIPLASGTTAGLNPIVIQIINELKQNVELLSGLRGSSADILNLRANRRGDTISILTLDTQRLLSSSARGNGFTVSGVNCASLAEFQKLIVDVNALAADVKEVRDHLNLLLDKLNGK